MTIARFLLHLLLLLCAATAPAQSLPDPATATRRVESAVEAVQGSVNNRVTFEGDAATLERLLSDYQSLLSMQQVEQYRGALEAARAGVSGAGATVDGSSGCARRLLKASSNCVPTAR